MSRSLLPHQTGSKSPSPSHERSLRARVARLPRATDSPHACSMLHQEGHLPPLSMLVTRLRRGRGRLNHTFLHTCPSIHTLPVLPGLVPVCLLRPSCGVGRTHVFLRPLDVSPTVEQAGRHAKPHSPAEWGLHVGATRLASARQSRAQRKKENGEPKGGMHNRSTPRRLRRSSSQLR